MHLWIVLVKMGRCWALKLQIYIWNCRSWVGVGWELDLVCNILFFTRNFNLVRNKVQLSKLNTLNSPLLRQRPLIHFKCINVFVYLWRKYSTESDEWVMSVALSVKLELIWSGWVWRMRFLYKNLFFYWKINNLLPESHCWNLTGYKKVLFCIDIGYQYQSIDTGLILD